MTASGTAAISEVSVSEDRLVRTAQALIRIDTQTPPSATGPIVEACLRLMADIPGLELTRHESEAPVVNLAARLSGGLPGPRLILSGHLDTFPIGDAGAWRHEPLGGAIEGGFLFGRGSADMKGAVACLIEVVRVFAHRRPFPGEIVLVLAGDEERMGEFGTQRMIDELDTVHGDGVIVADTGGPAAIRLGEKGMLWVTLSARGTAAHGAHVHAGDNAIDKLLAAVIAIRALEERAPDEPEEVSALLDAAARITGADYDLARRTMRRITVNVGRIGGGRSANLVPEDAFAELDIRLPLGTHCADIEQEIVRLLAPAEISFAIERRYEPTWTPPDSAVARAALAGTRGALGQSWHDGRIGGSDARLWRRAGYPSVVMGLTPRNLGAPDEALKIGELCSLTEALRRSAELFLGTPAHRS